MENISFEINHTHQGYRLFMCTAKRKVLNGIYATEEEANIAAGKLKQMINDTLNKQTSVRPKKKHIKVSLPTKSALQAAALTLDDERACKFKENFAVLVLTSHMMAYAFDELSCLFDSIVDKKVKAHYQNATKQIDKLLDALLQSDMVSDEETYTSMSQVALGLKERLAALYCYCFKDEWRVMELEKCLNNICPDEWHNKQRQEYAAKFRERLEKCSPIKSEEK